MVHFPRRIVMFAAALAISTIPAFAESLTEAMARAYANNPTLASAVLSVKIASEDIAQRKAGKRPNISLSANTGYSWSVNGGTFSDSGSGRLTLSYDQTLFDGLRTDAQIDQARALADAASQGLRNAEQNVLLSAASAYMDVVRDTQLASLRSDNVGFLQAQVKSARDRLEVGTGTRIDVSQAESRLAQAVAAYRATVNSLQISRAAYTRWVGVEPRNLNSDFRFGGIMPGSLDSVMASANASHPANLAAQAQVRAARYGSDLANRAFGPTLKLVGSITGSFTDSPPPGAANGTISGDIGLQLVVPIYAGGSITSGMKQANLNRTKAEFDAQATMFEVRQSAISAWSGYQTAIAQIESAQSAVNAAQSVLNGRIEEQKVGQATVLDVLNARAELTGAREALISAQRDKIVAAFSVVAAAGRLSAAELGLPVAIKTGQAYRQAVENDAWGDIRTVD